MKILIIWVAGGVISYIGTIFHFRKYYHSYTLADRYMNLFFSIVFSWASVFALAAQWVIDANFKNNSNKKVKW